MHELMVFLYDASTLNMIDGLIEKSESEWSSLVVMILKSDKTYIICAHSP